MVPAVVAAPFPGSRRRNVRTRLNTESFVARTHHRPPCAPVRCESARSTAVHAALVTLPYARAGVPQVPACPERVLRYGIGSLNGAARAVPPPRAPHLEKKSGKERKVREKIAKFFGAKKLR